VALLAGCVLALGADVSHAQARRHLQSRAAFAALDSPQLADSSRMLPRDRRVRSDSLLLDMWRWLDSAGTAQLGLPASRVRRWDGFGSQAHPALGILVDGAELDTLMHTVRRYKAAHEIPPDEIERRAEWSIRFLVSHEYGHLVQYAFVGRDTLENPDATRAVECSADMLGGLQFAAYLADRRTRDTVPAVAAEVARDFGYVIGGNSWLDGSTYPLPERRRDCIAMGLDSASVWSWREAVTRSLLRASEMAGVGARVVAERDTAGAAARISDVDVLRAASISEFVRRLATAAAKGSADLWKLRGRPFDADSSRYLPRETLADPWRCLMYRETADESARVECEFDIRLGETRDLSCELRQQLDAALEGTQWKVAQASGDNPYWSSEQYRYDSHVFYTLKGKNAYQGGVARVDGFVRDSAPPSAQYNSAKLVGFIIRARAR
jgi:hypothetical protein